MGSPEDEEALRFMSEAPVQGDRRGEGDPQWLANGAKVILVGLQSMAKLNGTTGQIQGFCDDTMRYRVRVDLDGTTKKVAKKNLQLVLAGSPPEAPAALDASSPALGEAESAGPPSTPSGSPPAAAPPTPAGTDIAAPSASPPSMALPPTSGGSNGAEVTTLVAVGTWGADPPPTREMVKLCIGKILRDVAALEQQCFLREQEIEVDTEPITDTHLRLLMSVDTYDEASEKYFKAFDGDEELAAEGDRALDSFAACQERYKAVRTYLEAAQDEWNYTRYTINRRGILGTLRSEFAEVAADVGTAAAHVAPHVARAGEVVQSASGRLAPLVRHATGAVGGAVERGSAVVGSATEGIMQRGQRQALQSIEEHVVNPVKRAWHLLATGFLLCFILPLFALRTYAPLNSVVSNLGIVYLLAAVCCPPRWARRRAARAGLLVLYPLVMVVMPLALHYWVMHPGTGAGQWQPPPRWQPSPRFQSWPQVPQLNRAAQPAGQSCRGGDCGQPGEGGTAVQPLGAVAAVTAAAGRAAGPAVAGGGAGVAAGGPGAGPISSVWRLGRGFFGGDHGDGAPATASVPWPRARLHAPRRRTLRPSLRGQGFSATEM